MFSCRVGSTRRASGAGLGSLTPARGTLLRWCRRASVVWAMQFVGPGRPVTIASAVMSAACRVSTPGYAAGGIAATFCQCTCFWCVDAEVLIQHFLLDLTSCCIPPSACRCFIHSHERAGGVGAELARGRFHAATHFWIWLNCDFIFEFEDPHMSVLAVLERNSAKLARARAAPTSSPCSRASSCAAASCASCRPRRRATIAGATSTSAAMPCGRPNRSCSRQANEENKRNNPWRHQHQRRYALQPNECGVRLVFSLFSPMSHDRGCHQNQRRDALRVMKGRLLKFSWILT